MNAIKVKSLKERHSFRIKKEGFWVKEGDDFKKEIILAETIQKKFTYEDGSTRRDVYEYETEIKLNKKTKSLFLDDGQLDGAWFHLSSQQIKLLIQILKKEKFI